MDIAFDLNASNPDLIPDIPYSPLNLPGVIPEHPA